MTNKIKVTQDQVTAVNSLLLVKKLSAKTIIYLHSRGNLVPAVECLNKLSAEALYALLYFPESVETEMPPQEHFDKLYNEMLAIRDSCKFGSNLYILWNERLIGMEQAISLLGLDPARSYNASIVTGGKR